jgi:putative hydrolase of the HAD superfamily
LATYEWVLQDANIIAGETLFIDDSINNIKGAMEAGIQTHLLLPTETIQQLQF